jgi:hypothetical protein
MGPTRTDGPDERDGRIVLERKFELSDDLSQ